MFALPGPGLAASVVMRRSRATCEGNAGPLAAVVLSEPGKGTLRRPPARCTPGAPLRLLGPGSKRSCTWLFMRPKPLLPGI